MLLPRRRGVIGIKCLLGCVMINDKYIWSIVYVHVRVYLERERGLREGGREGEGEGGRQTDRQC